MLLLRHPLAIFLGLDEATAHIVDARVALASGVAAEFYRVERAKVILARGFAMAATGLGLIAVVLTVSFLLFTAVGT